MDCIRRDNDYLSVFSPNAGKCGKISTPNTQWKTLNLHLIMSLVTEAHSKPCQTSKIQLFAKMVSKFSAVKLFHKKHHFWCLNMFWLRLCKPQKLNLCYQKNEWLSFLKSTISFRVLVLLHFKPKIKVRSLQFRGVEKDCCESYWFPSINPSHPNRGRWENINLSFCFHTSLWIKGLHKAIWGTAEKCRFMLIFILKVH